MKSNTPIKITEMDVEPISDEDLRGLAGSQIPPSSSYICDWGSDWEEIRPCCDAT